MYSPMYLDLFLSYQKTRRTVGFVCAAEGMALFPRPPSLSGWPSVPRDATVGNWRFRRLGLFAATMETGD